MKAAEARNHFEAMVSFPGPLRESKSGAFHKIIRLLPFEAPITVALGFLIGRVIMGDMDGRLKLR